MNKELIKLRAVLIEICLIIFAVVFAFLAEGDITVSVFALFYGNIYIYADYKDRMEDLKDEKAARNYIRNSGDTHRHPCKRTDRRYGRV